MKRSARFSRCRRYRYALWRVWDIDQPQVMIIGLNPSIADASCDDPTLRRCITYAQDWGFGGLCMANLFAYVATDPRNLKAAQDPIGPRNDRWLKRLAADADLVVAAWGNDGAFMDRSAQVRRRFPDLHCLAVNAGGEPAHPLYQRRSVVPRELGVER